MQINDLFHGFRVMSSERIDEIGAVLWRMEYEKNGAQLIWLERADDAGNKTFGIAFKTVPHDDTGVFHIIEHSVLCGSDKYPVREPFVELLKSSLATFLNAMTYPDKTVYPVSSRNDADFLNLMDVYLDAVFHPLSIRSPLAFRQEGWHWETGEGDDPGEVKCNGVVYNEMKGAYASADRMLGHSIDKLLFPDNCYSRSSGGDPAHIPELTYEMYLEEHRRFYSATNSRIFLDGMIDTEAVFSKLDACLSEYDRIEVDADIPLQKPVCPPEYIGEYAIGADEDPEGKVLAAEGWVFADYSEQEKTLAAEILADYLAGTNESPLSKAVLGRGLAEDISLGIYNGELQTSAVIRVKNTTDGNCDEIRRVTREVIENEIKHGVGKDRLGAILNSMEYSAREQDFGGTPRGLVYGLTTLDSWLYGGDPALPLRLIGCYRTLREKIRDGGSYFEDLLREIFIDCPHHACARLRPSQTLTAETAAAEAEMCRAAGAGWSEADRAKVLDDLAELRRFQKTADTPEQLATLPVLPLSDISETVPPSGLVEEKVNGVTVLRHTHDSNGIVYGALYFDLSDIGGDDLHFLSFLCRVFGDTDTELHSALEISDILSRDLGRFNSSLPVESFIAPDRGFRAEFKISFSALEANAGKILPILSEIMLKSKYDAAGELTDHLKQYIIDSERAWTMSGNSAAVRRAASRLFPADAFNEQISGFDQLAWARSAVAEIAESGFGRFAERLSALAKKIFVRERLTLSVTGSVPEGWIADVIASVPSCPEAVGPAVKREVRSAPGNEGIVIPAQIGFAAEVAKIPDSFGYTGACLVASQFLKYDYLWNEVRVKGGAYGTGMTICSDGRLNYSSYRDPQPGRSLGIFPGCGERLRELAKSGDDVKIDKYIISSLSSSDPLFTPRTRASSEDSQWFKKLPADRRQQLRHDILSTTKTDMAKIADMLDACEEGRAVCVVGGSETLDACGSLLDVRIPLK